MEQLARLEVKYGRGTLALTYPRDLLIDLTPQFPATDEAALVRAALDAPLGGARLAGAGEIVVVVNDITRPTPTTRLLPLILERLPRPPVILIASGNHRPHTRGEIAALLGAGPAAQLEVVDHDHRGDLVALGTTARGTPIAVNRRYAEATVRILIGSVAFHPFAGYSGGAKLVVPGLAGDATIDHNHAMALTPGATSGVLAGNPVREDLEEGLALCPPTFALHVVLDLDGRVVAAVAGDVLASHRACVAAHDRWYRVALDQPADAALVSPGGHPKDIDFRQSSKALEFAARGVRAGGTLLLCAACPDGTGSAEMERLWASAASAADLVDRIERGFVTGAQRVYPTALLCRDHPVHLRSQLADDHARRLLVTPAADPQAVLDREAAHGHTLLYLPAAGIEPACSPANC
jgi:nickel-dependent lactate racemase